jgi:hypothetical protein
MKKYLVIKHGFERGIIMEALPVKRVPVPNQKFDVGRTINFVKCSMCNSELPCRNFMNCDNYAKLYQQEPYSIQEWVGHFKNGFEWNVKMINHLFDSMIVKFPKGLYWDYDKYSHKIRFVEFRHGREICVAEISMRKYEVFVIDISDAKLKFINKVCQTINKINEMMIQ